MWFYTKKIDSRERDLTFDNDSSFFAGYGDIAGIKIPPGRGCAFVQFIYRQNAESAINNMNGFLLNGSRVRLSWGKNSAGVSSHPGGARPPPAMMGMPVGGGMDYYGQVYGQYAQPYSPMYPSSMTSGPPMTPVDSPSLGYVAASLPAPSTPAAASKQSRKPVEDPLQPVTVEEANAAFLKQQESRHLIQSQLPSSF